jgi:hypothetical protein
MRVGNIRRPLYAILTHRSGYPDRISTTIIPAKPIALVLTNRGVRRDIWLERKSDALIEIIRDLKSKASWMSPAIASQETHSKILTVVIGTQERTKNKTKVVLYSRRTLLKRDPKRRLGQKAAYSNN